jgi:hypothetical protein
MNRIVHHRHQKAKLVLAELVKGGGAAPRGSARDRGRGEYGTYRQDTEADR